MSLYIDFCYLLQGNIYLLENNYIEAEQYFTKIKYNTKQLSIDSNILIEAQLFFHNLAYKINHLGISLICQKTLLKLDPKLQFGNHYHNIACLYACKGDIKEANESFLEALKHNPKANLYVEYAQFLITNRDSIKLEQNSLNNIQKYLYAAINSNDDGSLSYDKMEINSVYPTLQTLIKQKNSSINIKPKILAYYLLVNNPEYRNNNNNDDLTVAQLLNKMVELCNDNIDETSFYLLANAYRVVGDTEVAEDYIKYAQQLGLITKIIEQS